MEDILLVMTNVPNEDTASTIARRLVENRLSACVNLLPSVRSVYRWKGLLEEANEITLLIKTTKARYAELEAAIIAEHPYEVPEIIALSVAAGLPAYLEWISSETLKEVNV